MRNYLTSNNLSLDGPIIVPFVDKYAPLRLGSASSLSDKQLIVVLGIRDGWREEMEKYRKKNINCQQEEVTHYILFLSNKRTVIRS